MVPVSLVIDDSREVLTKIQLLTLRQGRGYSLRGPGSPSLVLGTDAPPVCSQVFENDTTFGSRIE